MGILLKTFIILFLLSGACLAQNTKPLIATDNATQTCNATRMVFSAGSLSCSGSVATISGGSGSQTPWTGNVNGGGFNLTNVGAISASTLTAGSSSTSLDMLTIQVGYAAAGATVNATASTALPSSIELLLYLNNNLTDSSQNALTSTETNLTYNTTTNFATYYSGVFGGSTLITVPNETYFNPGSGNFTISFWYYPANTSQVSYIITKADAGFANGWGVYQSGTGVGVELETSSVAIYGGTAAGTFTTNTWAFVALERNGTTCSIYINGNSVASGTCTGAVGTNTSTIGVGGLIEASTPVAGYYISGNIQGFRYDNVALNPASFPLQFPYSVTTAYPTITESVNGSSAYQEQYSASTMTESYILGGSTIMTLNSTGLGIGVSAATSKIQLGGTCAAIGPVGTCWTATGQLGYCSGAANVCTTCTAC